MALITVILTNTVSKMIPLARLEKFVAGEFSSPSMEQQVEQEAVRLNADAGSAAVRGIVACRHGLPIEAVSKLVDWRSFERLCRSALEASGFETWENIVFTKPRMQVDVVAGDSSVMLSIDCKHWAASAGSSALGRAASQQILRSRRLGERLPVRGRPILSAIVTLTEQKDRFVSGAAVVPIHTLRDFAANSLSYLELLEVV